VALHTNGETPAGMVWIPAAPPQPQPLVVLGVHVPAVPIPPAWLDRYEVTNRQFMEFVKAGGYSKEDYWIEPFVKDGKTLSWQEAMDVFRDKAHRPGPPPGMESIPKEKPIFPWAV
jgi:formylglycine-generating enzyme required for sulfatase activity